MITRERAGGALICLALTGPLLNSALSAPTGSLAGGPIAVRVRVSTELNVRTSPSTKGGILTTAKDGAIYAAVARSGDFYKVWFAGRVAYMHGAYLEDAPNSRVTVTASSLNVRTGAGTSFAVLGQAPAGSVYTVLAAAGSWRKIQFGIGQGWIHSDYVRASKAGDGNSGGSTGGGSTGGGSTGGGSTGGSSGGYVSSPTKSAAGFIMLAPSGPGFFGYTPDSKRWGLPKLVYGIERVGRRWAAERPAGTSPRIGVGDISLKNGGDIAGHASHERGVDVDMSLPRNDGADTPRITRFNSKYSRAGTQKQINLFRAELPVTMIFFNDPNVTGRQNWPNHDNHYHVRISK